MPCLNEAETIAACIDKAEAAFAAHGIVGEVVIGDNGSTDGSQAIAEKRGAIVAPVARRGYGAALMGGIAAARGRYVVMADADDSYDFAELHKFVDKLRGGADFVIGCRFPKGGGRIMPGAMPYLHRRLGTPVLTAISKIFFGTAIDDINCGFRGFTMAVFKQMNLRSSGMEFASEMVMKAALMEIAVAQVPITLHPDGRQREPHLRTWRDGWRHLRFMLLYSPRWLFVIPGMVLFLCGLIGVVALADGPVSRGDVTFATNSHIVSSMATLLGFQIMSLGLIAKSYAVSRGLLPQRRLSDQVIRLMRMEHTIVAGIAISATGIGLLIWAVTIWGGQDFGALRPLEVPRIVIPSATLIVLGAQVFFSGFLLGLLGLHSDAD